jgi:hypothetical protein
VHRPRKAARYAYRMATARPTEAATAYPSYIQERSAASLDTRH